MKRFTGAAFARARYKTREMYLTPGAICYVVICDIHTFRYEYELNRLLGCVLLLFFKMGQNTTLLHLEFNILPHFIKPSRFQILEKKTMESK